MGKSVVITTEEKHLAIHLHWDGGQDVIKPLLEHCEHQDYLSPSADLSGWAHICQAADMLFGDTLSVSIDTYEHLRDQGENGIYIIDGWDLVDCVNLNGCVIDLGVFDFDEMIEEFGMNLPTSKQLGEHLSSAEAPTSELHADDNVWEHSHKDGFETFPIVGFGIGDVDGTDRTGAPFVKR